MLVLRVRPEVADLAAAVGKPVVAVPPHAAPVGVIRRVLVAWDGTPAMSASARQLAEAVLRAGREITAIPADTLVPALALARRSDLVVFGWSRRTSARHAGAVHAFLDSAPAPVALLTLPTRRWL